MTTPFDHLKAPFSLKDGQILDADGDRLAANISDEAFGNLVKGLLNGHFGVPVVFKAEPFRFVQKD